MSHTTAHRAPLVARLRRIRGQVEGLERALEGGATCSAVLQQAAAVRGAVNGLMAELIEDHLHNHVADPGLSAEARAEGAAELVDIIRRYGR
ncbi:metal/formaldehyde-sensitive transcriptional repressor [Phenylobacterium sp.]|uniref:metal/formaldehyde-sensitive transcriptional repressor n=1 Tax=Phenylobacterium sp. TaxID=1871053 RepID=UPI002633BB89|nr:metal/formaldehyde-sensitive transcriptional repressor [Phenylobacterium sp.]